MVPAAALDQTGSYWTWEGERRVATVRLIGSYDTGKPLTLALHGAGTFPDAVALQKAMNLRTQIRQAKRLMKLKLSQLLGDLDIKKQPLVIRRTEEVERELTAVVHNPRGAGEKAPDFAALRNRVIEALHDKPFNVDRTIPEVDPVAIRATRQVESGMFTSPYQGGESSEEGQMLDRLRGADLPAWLLKPQ